MKAKGLARVAALYGQVERVRLVELQEAAAAVAEAERLRVESEAAGAAHRGNGRAALARGEALGWRLAEHSCDEALQTAERAEALRAVRDVARAAAGELHRASRLRAGQVARIVEELDKAELLIEERREQAAADDRYAARLCWSRMKAG